MQLRLFRLFSLILIILLVAPLGVHGEAVAVKSLKSDALLVAYIPDPLVWEKLASVRVVHVANTGFHTVSAVGSEGSAGRPESIIIVGSVDLLKAAKEIAEIHEELGIPTKIVTVDWIVKHYGEAQLPPLAVEPSVVRECCNAKYNVSIALHIIFYLRDEASRGARYVLLLGDDEHIPPIYYHSPLLEYVATRPHSLVPTDYWYADPDYDGVVELAVGRLPFRYPWQAERYVEGLRAWVSTINTTGSAMVIGGALFQSILMIGETSALNVYDSLAGYYNTSLAAYSLETYGPGSIAPMVNGRQVVYIVAHGIGNRIVDVFPKGLWGSTFSELLSSRNTIGLKPTIFITPACMTAEWDYNIIPPLFNPPSVGYSMIEWGSAVAFLGPSRIAVEAIYSVKMSVDWGFSIGYAGMVRLLESIVKHFKSSKLLGDAVLAGLNEYRSLVGQYLAVLPNGVEDIAVLTMMEYTLLGDPAIPLPRGKTGTHSLVLVTGVKPPDATASARLVIQPLSSIAYGRIAVYKPPETYVNLSKCPSRVEVWALKRYYGYLLLDLAPVNYTLVRLDNGCQLVIRVSEPKPSLILVSYQAGRVAGRLLAAIAGTYYDAGRILVTGLDLVRSIGDEPVIVTVNGKPYTTLPGGVEGAVLNAPEGIVSINLWRQYGGITSGIDVEAEANALIKRLYSVRVPELDIRTEETSGGVLVAVLLDGKPVDANISVKPLTAGSLTVVRLDKGVYRVVGMSIKPILARLDVSINVDGTTYHRSLIVFIGAGRPSEGIVFGGKLAVGSTLAAAAILLAILLRRSIAL